MNVSIRKQLTVILIGLMAVMFLANYLVNTFFLGGFYSVRKQQALVKAYEMLNQNIMDDGSMAADKLRAYEDICNTNSIFSMVTDENYQRLIWTDTTYKETDYTKNMRGRLNGYMLGLDRVDDDAILKQTDKYTIQKKYDSAVAIDYLEMWGTLDKGFYFIMRINMAGILESVHISNEFITYICLAGALLAAVLVWFISRQVTKPLGELTELSKRMADLDFDVKYTSGGNNEIGQLGEHFNQMSEKLEKAYSQLLTANNELQKDIERKEQIDDMRKEFLSNVSHELKTPIALIQGYAEGLQECVNDDAESRAFYCEVIMDEASKMNGLVQKLLTLNQLEFGNDKTEIERFDLADLIRNKIQSVAILAQQKDAGITYHGGETVYVWGDEFKIEEILTNYLSNALNHIDGERRIEVTVQEQDNVVRTSVFNTGEQIPEEDIDLIWDKFYKVDKARTREYGGSGVGLSIVKAIMEAHHQKYGVENCGDGVRFWFELQSGSVLAQEGKKEYE
ncbi:MAG: HAMP domain-containing sensor histidine kinase [Lachnospiraceae bacterium]|nr:HAMP domain-containing sensor histidine kinase [Lachnospiraceae bacterium]